MILIANVFGERARQGGGGREGGGRGKGGSGVAAVEKRNGGEGARYGRPTDPPTDGRITRYARGKVHGLQLLFPRNQTTSR